LVESSLDCSHDSPALTTNNRSTRDSLLEAHQATGVSCISERFANGGLSPGGLTTTTMFEAKNFSNLAHGQALRRSDMAPPWHCFERHARSLSPHHQTPVANAAACTPGMFKCAGIGVQVVADHALKRRSGAIVRFQSVFGASILAASDCGKDAVSRGRFAAQGGRH
jgi:hypothetical protein